MAVSREKQLAMLAASETPSLAAYRARRSAAGLEPTPIEAAVNAAYGSTTAERAAAAAAATPQEAMAGVGLGAGAGLLLGGETALAGIAETLPAAVGGGISSLAGLLPAGVLGTIGTVAGAGLGIYGILQALGLGEGEGLFGLDILGGDTQYLDGIPLGGPGLAEPPAEYVEKEWHVSYDWGRLQYYLVKMPGQSRKIALYNTATKKWKVWVWRRPSLAVIGKNMPSHKMITRLRRNLRKHSTDARTILKMTNPKALRTTRRRR